MKEKMVATLLGFTREERSELYKNLATMAGGAGILLAGPLLIHSLVEVCPLRRKRKSGPAERAAGAASIAVGLGILGWAVWTQRTVGGGTPNPLAPTRRLVTEGPYAFCRNPIQLGAMCYVSGIETMLAGFPAGLAALAASGVPGTVYHMMVEENELEARFGKEYLKYRESTPFLIPRCR